MVIDRRVDREKRHTVGIKCASTLAVPFSSGFAANVNPVLLGTNCPLFVVWSVLAAPGGNTICPLVMLCARSIVKSTSISSVAFASALMAKDGPMVRIPGKESPGMPTWKREMVPESIVPVTFASRLSLPSMLALKSAISLSVMFSSDRYNHDGKNGDVPAVRPSSVIFGGISDPAATIPT